MGGINQPKLAKPGEGFMGTYTGNPKTLLTEFRTAQSQQGELEGLRSVRKKYNIKPKKIHPREKALLAKEQSENLGTSINKKTILGG